MRVLLMTWACDREDVSEPGVSARWVSELSRDHEVTVFAVSRPERFGCVRDQFPHLDVIEWRDLEVPCSFQRFRAIVKPGYIAYYLRAKRLLSKLARERSFDVIHHLSPFAWRYPSPATGLGVPLIRGPVAGGVDTPPELRHLAKDGSSSFMILRETDRWRLKFDPILRKSYRRTDHVLFAASYVRELLRPLAIGSSSIEIELGTESEIRKSGREVAGLPASAVTLLYVGRIVATKGLRLAIRALAQSRCHKLSRLMVVGDGEDLMSCQQEVNELGLGERVQFLGWLSKELVRERYREADVFVFPSFREPTGGVVLEAMTHGLPVITCAYGGPDDLVDERCGVKVRPGSEAVVVHELAAAFDRLASPEVRAEMGHQALERAKEFGWEAKRTRISRLYEQLASHCSDNVSVTG